MNNNLLPKTLLPFIWHFAKRYCLAFCIFLFVPVLLVVDSTIMPYGIKMIVDGIANAGDHVSTIPTAVWQGAGLYLGSFVFLIVVYRSQEWYQTIIIPKFMADIRMGVLAQLSQQSYLYFSNHMAGKLANKVSDLPSSIDEMRLILCWNIIGPLSVAISVVLIVGFISPLAAISFLVWLLGHVGGALWYSGTINKRSHTDAEYKSQLAGLTVDFLSNMIPVKLFARRRFEIELIGQAQDLQKTAASSTAASINYLRIFMDIWAWLMIVFTFGSLIYTWQHGGLTPGDVTFVMMCVISALNQLWFAGHMLAYLFKHIGVANQALEMLAVPIMVTDAANAEVLHAPHGKIEFEAVSFQYHHERALFTNKNLIIEAGTKVGLVGYSGSGKTTFIHLILRFFDVTGGRILIDGQNIADVTQDSLHEHIAMVPQDTSLFHRTLMDNIRYGRLNATDDEVIAASKAAHCHEFILSLPEGYDTLVGERGLKLSGGQRQRIAIARAMLKHSPILILDEATSALDSITEQYIQEAMGTLMHQRTTIVVAHRLSTLAQMDRILVFDKGHVIEEGSHDVLLSKNGHYARLWRMQAGGFLPEH